MPVLNKDQLASIGAVAVECTYLDSFVEAIIWSICQLDIKQGKFFTSMMQLDKKLDLLSDLGKQKLTEAKIKEFTEIISYCKLANNDRNTIIHGTWISADAGLAPLLFPDDTRKGAMAIKRRLRSEALTFSADKVDAVAARLSNAITRLFNFANENGWLA